MNLRLIALDLDGTTLNSKKQLTEKTKAALIAAARQGVEIVPVTGRCFHSLPPELLSLDKGRCIRYAIISNGAEIRDVQTGEILYEHYISSRGIEEIKKALYKEQLMVEIYVKGSAYIEKYYYDQVESGLISYRSRHYVVATRVPVKGVIHLLDVHRNRVEKVAVYFDPYSGQCKIKAELAALEHVQATSSGMNNIELMAEGCGKARGLEALCHRLDVPLSATMAIGDGENDMEMLRLSGVSAAMGNASAEVKACADFVAGSNDSDGVAKVVCKAIKFACSIIS